jgi:hypothetical protein
MTPLTQNQIDRVRHLYRLMPGAPEAAIEDAYFMWGDVEGNEHWEFCEAIVRMVDRAVGDAINTLASAHNLV